MRESVRTWALPVIGTDLEYARKLAAEWDTPEFTDEGTIEQLAATILKSIHKERVQCSKYARLLV